MGRHSCERKGTAARETQSDLMSYTSVHEVASRARLVGRHSCERNPIRFKVLHKCPRGGLKGRTRGKAHDWGRETEAGEMPAARGKKVKKDSSPADDLYVLKRHDGLTLLRKAIKRKTT